jgi:hypothetical protein
MVGTATFSSTNPPGSWYPRRAGCDRATPSSHCQSPSPCKGHCSSHPHGERVTTAAAGGYSNALETCQLHNLEDVTNSNFRVGWPIRIRPTFCLASLLCMSTGYSQVSTTFLTTTSALVVARFWPRTPCPHFLRASLTMCGDVALR